MNETGAAPTKGRIGLDRYKAFSDGVLAIVITILVLTIEVPKGYDFKERGFGSFLLLLEDELRPYLASFMLVATYWMQNVIICQYARYATRAFVWIGILFLLFVTLVPFAVDLHGEYPRNRLTLAIFGAIHIACFLTLLAQWRYVTTHCRDGAGPVAEHARRSVSSRLLAAVGLTTFSILVSFWSLRVGAVLFLTVPAMFLSHRAADSGLGAESVE